VTSQAIGAPAPSGRPWGLWGRQVLALVRLDTRRIFRGKGTILLLLLPLMPVMISGLRVLVTPDEEFQGAEAGTAAFAVMYQHFIIPFVVLVGCAIVFGNLFRKELLDRTLHYHFLLPVRREVLTAGKFAAGFVATSGMFVVSVVVTYLLLYVPYGIGASANHLFLKSGLLHLVVYVAVTAMACLGYGALFMACGILFRNPIFPAIVLIFWEYNSELLPPLLKKISVIHYVRSLSPVPIPENSPFALIADPTPAWLAVPGFLVFAAVVLFFAAYRVRRLEVSYGDE
jgi:ABC-type transport system involved in multi-copper enzyme maturation permease subunit